ncbi:MAG: hypothetical protein PT944_04700 [Actinomycetaceae bacterium]|nr:hypothetical protein [Arcanobacterium sp.]MDD7687198.1 hypothetical protein [Actinomycetaceae bacterium]MDY5273505.1 hypothetical protein [Arcanobacterium sp.]
MELTDIQKQVLRYIQNKKDWATIAEIAEDVDAHPNSVRAAVTTLTDDGVLERKQYRDGKKGRPTYIFRARQGRFTMLKDALRAMESATDDEQHILEALISGRYEGSLEESEDLEADVVEFLKNVDVDSYEENHEVHVTSCPFREINDGQAGYTCRIHRMIIQQAIGSRGLVQLSPLHANNECRIRIKEINNPSKSNNPRC